MTPPAHLFLSEVCGDLHDCRDPDWSRLPPLRANYARGYRDIEDTAQLRATLRHGQYAWPGAYPMYFLTSDGAALSFGTVRANLRQVLEAIAARDNSGWRVIGCDVNWEDTELTDGHTGEPIESAYA